MALYAAYNIAQAVKNFAGRSYATLSGIILNRRNIENEEALVQKAAGEIGTEIIGDIPRCSLVQEAEEQGKTVLELFPSSDMSRIYRSLALALTDSADSAVAV
jgi:nitrogenase iron protein NifH